MLVILLNRFLLTSYSHGLRLVLYFFSLGCPIKYMLALHAVNRFIVLRGPLVLILAQLQKLFSISPYQTRKNGGAPRMELRKSH